MFFNVGWIDLPDGGSLVRTARVSGGNPNKREGHFCRTSLFVDIDYSSNGKIDVTDKNKDPSLWHIAITFKRRYLHPAQIARYKAASLGQGPKGL